MAAVRGSDGKVILHELVHGFDGLAIVHVPRARGVLGAVLSADQILKCSHLLASISQSRVYAVKF